jgi:hypothetical protein
MKTVCLTPEEQKLLIGIMQCCLSDLRVEITGTDHWEFKRSLRERKAMVIQLLEKLQAAQSENEPA